MRFVNIKFYPGTEPEKAFILVKQGWADMQLTSDTKKWIHRLSNTYFRVFDKYVNNMPAIKKRWPKVNAKNHLVIHHTIFPDMIKTIAVSISGEVKFEQGSIKGPAIPQDCQGFLVLLSRSKLKFGPDGKRRTSSSTGGIPGKRMRALNAEIPQRCRGKRRVDSG